MHSVGKHTADFATSALVTFVALVSVVGMAWPLVILGDYITVHIAPCDTDLVGPEKHS